jgi:hypothetical protein
MQRFYFHLSAPDQNFPDNIGSDVSDLAAAHFIAVRLMKRVMMISAFADCAPDLRRWTVKVTDERRRPAFTVLFPAYFAPRGWKPVLVSGARTLLMRLDAMNAVDDKSQGRIAAPPPGAFEASTNSGRQLFYCDRLREAAKEKWKWSPPPTVSSGKSRLDR